MNIKTTYTKTVELELDEIQKKHILKSGIKGTAFKSVKLKGGDIAKYRSLIIRGYNAELAFTFRSNNSVALVMSLGCQSYKFDSLVQVSSYLEGKESHKTVHGVKKKAGGPRDGLIQVNIVEESENFFISDKGPVFSKEEYEKCTDLIPISNDITLNRSGSDILYKGFEICPNTEVGKLHLFHQLKYIIGIKEFVETEINSETLINSNDEI